MSFNEINTQINNPDLDTILTLLKGLYNSEKAFIYYLPRCSYHLLLRKQEQNV